MAHRKATLAATCHCGAIRIHVSRVSRTLTSCNCSICRRYGALWAYYAASSVKIEAPKGGLSKYSWNRKIRAYYRCKKCGCVTHYAYRKKHRNTTIAVNAVNFEAAALAGARIRHLDGAALASFVSDERLRFLLSNISYIFDVIHKDTGRFCRESWFLQAEFRENRFRLATPARDLAPIFYLPKLLQ